MVRLRSIRHPLRRLTQVGNRDRLLVIEAVVSLLLARLALVFIPFSRLARLLGTVVPPGNARVLQARLKGANKQVRAAEEVSWAVTRSARYVPFRAVCLPQAMAARIMLKRRGVSSVLHFGVGKGKKKPLEAHAWLDAAGIEVTGYPVPKSFAEIACFV
jgi:hypothetical protein